MTEIPTGNICNRCGKEFDFPSHLERHQNKKYSCKYNQNENNSLDENEDINTLVDDTICEYCNKKLVSKYNKERHLKSCTKKLSEEIEDNETIVDSKIIENKKVFEKNKIKSFLEDRIFTNENAEENKTYLISLIKELFNRNIDNNSTNNNNSLTTGNGNDNVNIIGNNNINGNNINNTTNINLQVVYPFGLESIDNITIKDFVDILRSDYSLKTLVDCVYDKNENRNFHKRNLNKDMVSALNIDLEIDVIKEKEFREQMINNLILLFRRLFNKFKKEFKLKKQIVIWRYIKYVEESLEKHKQELTNKISTLLQLHTERKSIKDYFREFIEKIENDKQYKKLSMDLIKTVKNEIKEYKKELKTITKEATNKYIDDEVSNYDTLDSDDDMDSNKNNLDKINDVYKTSKWKYMREVMNNEIESLSNCVHTLGNIDKLVDRYADKYKSIYEDFFNKFNLSSEQKQELYTKVIELPKQSI